MKKAEIEVRGKRIDAEAEAEQQLGVLDNLIDCLGDILDDSEDDRNIYCEARKFIKGR